MQQHCQLHRGIKCMDILQVFKRQTQEAVNKSQPSESAFTAMEGKISKQDRIQLHNFFYSLVEKCFFFLFSLKKKRER